MNRSDARIIELFTNVRRVIDIIEELMLRPSAEPVQQTRPAASEPPPFPSPSSIPLKFAYSIREVRELVGISNSSICKEIGEGRLRVVKRGNRTMILASDLQNCVSSWPVSRQIGKLM